MAPPPEPPADEPYDPIHDALEILAERTGLNGPDVFAQLVSWSRRTQMTVLDVSELIIAETEILRSLGYP
jgi:hypothetical protein